jgi:hypothetical protein
MSDSELSVSTDLLGPDGKLHQDGYFTWHRRDGYVLDAKLPAEFVLADKMRAALDQKHAEYENLKQTMRDMTRNYALQLEAARMAGVHSVHEQTALIVRAALELLEAVEGCEGFPPEKRAAFRRVFGA